MSFRTPTRGANDGASNIDISARKEAHTSSRPTWPGVPGQDHDLRNAVRAVKQRHPFDIVAWVVLPDRLHAIGTLPAGDGDCATRWMLISAAFSRAVPKGERIRATRRRKDGRGIWQRRFWEYLITDENDLRSCVDYVHINPVKHGCAARGSDWPYSSIHRYIRLGLMPGDWAATGETGSGAD